MANAKRLNRRDFGALAVATTLGCLLRPQELLANAYLRRWLKIQRISGDVTTITAQRKRASVGDQLTSIGHGLITGPNSTAHLAVDDGIASLAVAQNTQMTIQQLSVLPDGGRVTVLDVPQGQVRFQVRQFTNPNSRLELRTPSGVAAVRGTNFGISVNQEGQTNVAALEGQVEAGAQGSRVAVNPGQVSIIYPGSAPTEAKDLDRELDIRWQDYEWREEGFYMAGFVDAANLLWVNDQQIPVDRAGYFEQIISAVHYRRVVSIMVQNPMGETRIHRVFPRVE